MPITVSGTAITFNDATTQTTAFTGGGGTVTSVATGNGLQGGTITTSGTLSVACPSFNTVGSYVFGNIAYGTVTPVASGGTLAAGTSSGQLRSGYISVDTSGGAGATYNFANNLSGTWRSMNSGGFPGFTSYQFVGVFCRVS
jgi:hypothetical protein